MVLRLLLALVYVATLCTAAAQDGAVATLTTDKAVYEYGEPIVLQYILANEGDEEFFYWAAAECSAAFRWGSLLHPGENGLCALTEMPVQFPPGSRRVWTWHLVPAQISTPETDGEQIVRAVSGIWFGSPSDRYRPPDMVVRDSSTFTAPLYLGGRMCVQLAQDLTLNDVADVMDDLNATEINEVVEEMWPPARCRVYDPVPYVWEIEGITVAAAIERYGADERFLSMELFRTTVYSLQFFVGIEPGGERTEAGLSAPFPNPASSSVRLEFVPSSDGEALIELLDVRGRRVALLHQGVLLANQPVTVTIEAPHLASGTYVVRASGPGYAYSRAVTVVR